LISLVGMPGVGKSTVGRQLARQLGLPFFDSDHEIEAHIGMSIRAYFELHGEPAFRDLETQTIERLAWGTSCVLATGGGAPLREQNRAILREHTHVIYLRSTPEDLFRRLRHDTTRPLLQVKDPLKRLRDLFRERDPIYLRTAHFVIETGRPSVPALLQMILMQLELAGVVDASCVPSPIDPHIGPEQGPA
jgi:shikimate kinase